MDRALTALALVTVLGLSLPVACFGEAPAGSTRSLGPRKQVATIIFAGLAGAVLGLSTLSFYGRPQDRLSNIAVGFAVGVIIGTTYTTYKAATEAHGFADPPPDGARLLNPELWRLADRHTQFERTQTLGWNFQYGF